MELRLNDAQTELLRKRAKSLGIAPEELARAAVADLLSQQEQEFSSALDAVLEENAELYERLS